MTVKRILCPTDFSGFSRRALAHAIAVARWYGADVTVLHVVPVLFTTGLDLPAPVPAAPLPAACERLFAELDALVKPAERARVPVRKLLVQGDPVACILRQAREMNADLIVLGTHGARGFERWVLGSVTEKVLRKAECPVMTVPRADDDAPGEFLFRTVLCPVDFSECSRRALSYAADVAREAQAQVVAVHILDWLPPEDPRMNPELRRPEYRAYVEAEVLDRLRRFLSKCETARDPVALVRGGRPYTEILKLAKEKDAGVIVMGVQGRGAFDLMLFGSTTHHVIREAVCPVLTVKTSTKAGRPVPVAEETVVTV